MELKPFMHTLMYTQCVPCARKRAYFEVQNKGSGYDRENKKSRQSIDCQLLCGEPAGARTQDPNIKSVVLYLLSYGFSRAKRELLPDFGGANVGNIFVFPK